MWIGVAVLTLASCLLWYLSFGGTLRDLWGHIKSIVPGGGGSWFNTGRRGYTTIELIISIFILLAVALSLFGLFLVFKILWNLAFPG